MSPLLPPPQRPEPSHRRRPTTSAFMLALSALGAGYALSLSAPAQAQLTPEIPPTPQTLKGASRPEPSNLGDFVMNKSEAIALGKALFWDMQVGSDGKTACASCHFQAGADSRGKNQVTPGLNRMASLTTPNPDTTFQVGGPNYQFKPSDFPFHKLSDINDRNSTVLRSFNDSATSQGVFNEKFVSVTNTKKTGGTLPAASTNGTYSQDPFANWYSGSTEQRVRVTDSVFHVGVNNTRRVEPRNSPTVINAVFNFRNFWDGRAEYIFNGVNPFGLRDPNAFLFKNVASGTQWSMQPTKVRIDNASLASQASGPPGSDFEMSAAGRTFPDLGRKMLYLRPLQGQQVATTDSVLGTRRHSSGLGLSNPNYADMVKKSFRPEWWNSDKLVQIGTGGAKTVVPFSSTPTANQYTQMQHNFSLFFSLAVQLYEATLVSDDAPFDRYMTGNTTAMSSAAQQGMGLFFGKGKCANCHGGPEFTNASVRKMLSQPLNRMVMGDGQQAVYDEGFYNIGITKTLEDLGAGNKDPFGNPFAMSALGRIGGSALIKDLVGITPNVNISATERVAYNGAFKTPTVRNAELTAPYFHNGGAATLRQLVDFYDRGGNFHANNIADLDADITDLGLSGEEKTALVEFIKALTDDRVRFHAAPFDHPQLMLPNGHVGDTSSVTGDGTGRAVDTMITLPAVGASGYAKSAIPANFLNVENSGQTTVQLVTRDGRCVGNSAGSTVLVQTCSTATAQKFKLTPEADTSYRVAVQNSGYLLELVGGGTGAMGDGVVVDLWPSDGGQDQHWRIEDIGAGYSRLRNRLSNKCLEVNATGSLVQWSCDLNRAGQALRLLESSDVTYIQQALKSSVFGGPGGNTYTDDFTAGQAITGLVVRSGWWVDGVQLLSSADNTTFHGGTGGNVTVVSLQPGETLVRITGQTGYLAQVANRVVGSLSFTTNTGRVIGPFGTLQGLTTLQAFDFAVPAGKRIVGLTGRSGQFLDAVGVIYAP